MYTIDTNRIYCSTGSAGYYASGTPASADYDVEATVYIASLLVSQNGICGRMSTNAITFYYLYLERSSAGGGHTYLRLSRFSAGSGATQGSSEVTPAAGESHTLKLHMVGDQISGYYDAT